MIIKSLAGCSSTATATALNSKPNCTPVAVDDIYIVAEDIPVTLTPLTLDSDADNDSLTIISINGTLLTPGIAQLITVANGIVNISAGGVITFQSTLNFNSATPLSIPYVISDGNGGTATANQLITVTAVNDAPIADNDTNTTSEDTPTVGGDLTDAGDSDPDGTPLLVTTTPVSGPTNGTIEINADGTYVYTPNPNFNGTDVITIEVCDSGSPLPKSCVNQTLTITVTAVNDAPIVDNDTNTTSEDTPTVGGDLTDAGDSDPDGTPLLVTTTPVSGPTNGTIEINADGTYVYTPNPNFNGTDIITIEVCDSGSPLPKSCVNQTLTITVTAVNDLPVAKNDSAITLSDTNVNVSVASNDSDIDGTINPATIDLNTSLSGIQTTLTVSGQGTYTANSNGTVTFDPLPSFSGTTTPVNYTIQDNEGGVSNTATITVVVGACVDNPILDCDGDGVSNGREIIDGTNPLDQCSFRLVSVSLTPSANWLAADCDNDGLTNGREVILGTDPLNPDTDGDGVLDGTEVADGTNPLDPCDSIEEHVTVKQSPTFLNGDCDEDGLSNGEEIGNDPTRPFDSNGNGIPDYLEVNNHNESNSEDDIEIFNGVSPTSDDIKNNVFTIRNIEKFPNNTVEIYNRWGVLVYQVSGYGQGNNFFRGESQGRVTVSTADQLPEDTYFYVLKYIKSDGTVKERKGYLYINR